MSLPLDFSVVRYSSAADIVAAYATGCEYATFAALEAADFKIDGTCVGVDGEAQHDPAFLTETIAETVTRRVWGFSVGHDVHLWIGQDASAEDIAELLGHELGHVVRNGDDGPRAKPTSDEEWEREYEAAERDADTYGAVALAVHRFLSLIGEE